MGSGEEILTVGHSNHEEGEFIELLHGAGVELIADVRANPRSRHPHFNGSALAGAMKSIGIGYAPLGGDLGGRRQPLPDSVNEGWELEAFRGYADHMASDEFRAAYDRLRELARAAPTAFMCAETLWWKCHRRLLADRLTADGWTVVQLRVGGPPEPHRLTDAARVEQGRLSYD